MMERKDWKVVKLGDVCDIISGSTPKTKEPTFWEGKHFWITPAELKGDKWVSSTERTLTDEGVKNAHLQILPVGTVLLSSRAPIGKIAITTVPMYCNQGFKNLVCSDLLKNEYLYWYLLYKEEYIKSLGVGATFKEISKTIVASIPIPVPPLPVQARIVDELDCLQGILSKKRQQLAEYHSLAQAIFHQMFGDPVVNEKGWEMKRLGEVTNKIGSGATPKGGDKSYKKEGISLIRSLNVFNSYFKEENLAHIDNEQALALKNVTIEQGDILLNITGASVARCCIVPKHILPARVNQHVSIIRLNDSANQVFLAAQLTNTHMQEKILNISREKAATREALTKSQIEEFSIILPPLPLQQSFAARIAAIDSQREQLAASIRELETLFACRMETLLNCPQA